jgi:hypothetical protein
MATFSGQQSSQKTEFLPWLTFAVCNDSEKNGISFLINSNSTIEQTEISILAAYIFLHEETAFQNTGRGQVRLHGCHR